MNLSNYCQALGRGHVIVDIQGRRHELVIEGCWQNHAGTHQFLSGALLEAHGVTLRVLAHLAVWGIRGSAVHVEGARFEIAFVKILRRPVWHYDNALKFQIIAISPLDNDIRCVVVLGINVDANARTIELLRQDSGPNRKVGRSIGVIAIIK